MEFFVFIVAFTASLIGAICGVGGGILIKPVMDALGGVNIVTVNFLSGCTVVSMTLYSVVKARKNTEESQLDMRIDLPLALGAMIGGFAGKHLFSVLMSMYSSNNFSVNYTGAIQAAVLLLIALATLVYTLKKSQIKTLHFKKTSACFSIGVLLGLSAAFLGIGGGPINLFVLSYFFSMTTKRAVQSSLYIMLFSQAMSTIAHIFSGALLSTSITMIVGMAACGILGGFFGRKINRVIDDKVVDKLFICLMLVIMGICCFNVIKYF